MHTTSVEFRPNGGVRDDSSDSDSGVDLGELMGVDQLRSYLCEDFSMTPVENVIVLLR